MPAQLRTLGASVLGALSALVLVAALFFAWMVGFSGIAILVRSGLGV
jgi:hypothetical protein